MSRQILAIDIRQQAIAAVLLSVGLKSTTIVSGHTVPIATVEDNDKPLESALTAIAQQVSAATVDVVVGLPADRTTFRALQVPFNEEKKIRQVLPFELEPHVPVPVDRLIIDFISTDTNGGALLAAAVDRQHIEEVTAALASAGLRPRLIVPGDFPLAAALLALDEQVPEQALFLSVGDDSATLFLLDNQKIALARSMAINSAVESDWDMLAAKIRQTLIAYAENRPETFKPSRLYVGGPTCGDGQMVERLTKALEMAAQVVDLQEIASIASTGNLNGAWSAPLMDGALALAMVETERLPCPCFHRSGSTLRNYWTSYRQYLRAPAVLLGLVLLLGMGGVLVESHLLQKQVDALDVQIEEIFKETFPQVRRVGDAGDQMKSELQKLRTGGMDAGEEMPQVRIIDILMQISRTIPKEVDVLFTRLVLGSDGITLSGETTAFNVVDEIKNGLEQGDMFQEVTIASANMEKSGNKVRFRLKLTL